MRISDWSSDVCSSDLDDRAPAAGATARTGDDAGGRGLGGRDLPGIGLPLRAGEDRDSAGRPAGVVPHPPGLPDADRPGPDRGPEIGRASCRGRVGQYVSISVVAVSLKKKNKDN